MAKPSGPELRKFRHDISTLKKAGLLSSRIDARKAKPSRKLNRILDRFDNVLSGKASAVRLSPTERAKYKALGKPYEIPRTKGVKKGTIIIPHEAGEKVSVRGGKVVVSNPAGIKRVLVPVKYQNLEQFLNDLAKRKPELAKNEYLGFRFYGNRSLKLFRTFRSLSDYLSHYESVFESIEENNAEAMEEIYQNLEIVTIDRPDDWKRPPATHQPSRRQSQSYEARKRKLERGPEIRRIEHREKNAERQREWRRRTKRNHPAKWKQIQNANNERSKKSKKRLGRQ